MKRLSFLCSVAAFLFLLQLAAMPGLALAEATPQAVTSASAVAVEPGWEGLPILAQPQDLQDMMDDLEAGEGLTPEQQKQLEQGIMAFIAAFAVFFIIAGVIGLAIAIFILFLIYKIADSIPEEHQKVSPGMVWLMIIPCVGIIMAFIVYPGISKGFRSYFDSLGRTDVGDCGAGMVKWYLIVLVAAILLSWVPLVGGLLGITHLVMFILMLVKLSGLKNEVGTGGAAAA